MAQSKGGRALPGWGGFIVVALSLLTLSGPMLAGPMDTGGSFSVSPSGAATYTIPIAVPPGTGGIEPKLALSYNSQAGNGLLGVGWNLSGLSAIGRCPRTMAQDGVRGSINFDANDRYCLDGQRLIAVSGTYGAAGTEYRTELESFSKIIGYGGTTGDTGYFKVWTKAGQIIEYGNTADSRIEAQGKTQARAWAMNKISDTKGNYLTVTYTEDNANGDFYPSRIDYTGNANTGLVTNNSVRFVYEARPDISTSYGASAKTMQSKRLAKVQLFASSSSVKEFRLVYATDGTTGRSRLVTFTECASDGNCFPPILFSWLPGGGVIANSANGAGGTHAYWDSVIDSPIYKGKAFVGDFNGDGKTDLMMIYRDPNSPTVSIYHWNSDASGKLTFAGTGNGGTHAYWDSVIDSPVYKGKAFVGDFNGDGKTDLMMIYRDPNSPTVSIYQWNADATGKLSYVGNGNGGTHAYWDSVLDSPVYKGEAFVGDFNGDGKTDLMMIYRDPNSPTVSIFHWNADATGKLSYAGTGNGGTHAYWDSVIDSPLYKGMAFVGDCWRRRKSVEIWRRKRGSACRQAPKCGACRHA